MTVLAMHGVHLSYGATAALTNIDLEIEAGELVAVTGRSGSGKSSLLNIAAGLLAPTAGGVSLGGQALGGRSGDSLAELRRETVGFVFQSLNLLPRISVLDNVALPLELGGMALSEARARALSSLDSIGLADRADDAPAALSGGEQQRVAVARALAVKPPLVVGDEPTAALDPVTADSIMLLIRGACDEGAAGLIVTHDPAQAAWADRVINLRDGCIVSTTARVDSAPISAPGEAE